MADDPEKAAQALKEMFRRDAIEAARTSIKPRRHLLPEGRAMAWIIVILCLAAFGSLFTFVGLHVADQLNASNTVNEFCTAEAEGNYTAAYQLLSQRMREQMSSNDLATATKSAHLTVCSLAQSPWFIPLNGNYVTVDVTYFTSVGGADGAGDLGSMTLVREHGSWRIDAASSLNLP
jgi:hypothetical protein